MFDFGDELLLRSFKVPWLIWIQILVMFLLTLVIFLSYFEFFDLDSSPPRPRHPLTCSASTQGAILKEREQVAGNHNASVEIATSTSNRTRRAENNSDTDDSSLEELTPTSISERFCHPCRYFDLAKEAFLKCLGLGSSSRQDSPPRQQRHED